MSFYTAVIILVWMALAILMLMVHSNEKISHKNRQALYVTYCLVAVSALAEWLGVRFNGDPSVPIWLLRTIKALDFTLTPLAGRLLIRQLQIKNGILKIMTGILIFNSAFQAVSLFTDWMITVDSDHYFHEGSLYWVFILESIIVLMLIIAQFMVYGRSYRKRNRFSLYAVLVMVICGIVFQEVIGNDIRTDYIAVMFGLLFLYIHFNGYSQQSADDKIRRQEKTITTDSLTGLKSRYAYAEALKEYNVSKPEGLVAFSIDINGLKKINDTLGHEAGDELVKGAAECIGSVFMKQAFRTGGDEFIVLVPDMSESEASKAVKRLKDEAKHWRGEYIDHISLSVGYALLKNSPELSIEGLVREADMQMYVAKDRHYEKRGIKRR